MEWEGEMEKNYLMHICFDDNVFSNKNRSLMIARDPPQYKEETIPQNTIKFEGAMAIKKSYAMYE